MYYRCTQRCCAGLPHSSISFGCVLLPHLAQGCSTKGTSGHYVGMLGCGRVMRCCTRLRWIIRRYLQTLTAGCAELLRYLVSDCQCMPSSLQRSMLYKRHQEAASNCQSSHSSTAAVGCFYTFQELEHVHVTVQRAAVPLQKAAPLCSRGAAPEACTWTGMERQSSACYAIPCCSLRSSHMAQPANAAVPCSWRQMSSHPYSYFAMVIPYSSSQGRGFAVWTAGFQDASQASPASWFHRPALSHRSMARCFRAPASCLAWMTWCLAQ